MPSTIWIVACAALSTRVSAEPPAPRDRGDRVKNGEDEGHAHAASRVILASPRTLFRAFVDAETMAAWRAPDGMTATMLSFDPRPGGG